MLYLASMLVLFLAELCSNLHTLATIKNNKRMASLFSAISSTLWCMKMLIIVNKPLTLFTAFIGAYLGSICAWHIWPNSSTKE